MSENELAVRAHDALEYVRSLKVDDQKSLDLAGKVLRRIGQIRKEIKDFFEDPIKKAYEAHKSILTKKKEMEKPLDDAEKDLKSKVRDYHLDMEKKRKEAEEKARQAELEQKKKEEEALRKAQALQDEGKIDEALDELDKVEERPAVEIPKEPLMKGIHTRQIWKWELLDINVVPRKYLTLDEPMISNEVRAGVREIPGIRVYQDTIVSRSR